MFDKICIICWNAHAIIITSCFSISRCGFLSKIFAPPIARFLATPLEILFNVNVCSIIMKKLPQSSRPQVKSKTLYSMTHCLRQTHHSILLHHVLREYQHIYKYRNHYVNCVLHLFLFCYPCFLSISLCFKIYRVLCQSFSYLVLQCNLPCYEGYEVTMISCPVTKAISLVFF